MLDNQKFNTQCHKIKGILTAYGYFLRVFELKGIFCHLIKKHPKNQNIVRQLSSCITEKYNGFPVTATEHSKKSGKTKPVDIIYKPINSPEKKIVLLYARYL